jgi:hypothetical protein
MVSYHEQVLYMMITAKIIILFTRPMEEEKGRPVFVSGIF